MKSKQKPANQKLAELLKEIRKAAKEGQQALDSNGTMVGYEDFEAIKTLAKQALAQL